MAREFVLDFDLELLNERYPLPATLASLCCINKSFVVSINANHVFFALALNQFDESDNGDVAKVV